MECLKCGRETPGKEIFCAECLNDMEKFPVKTGTPVVIPKREEPRRQVPQKKAPKPEEIIAGLHQTIHRLRVALCIVSILLALTAAGLGLSIWYDVEDPEPGFNYSTVTFPTEGGNR